MVSRPRLWLPSLLLPAALALAAGSLAAELEGVPVVVDGDTIEVDGRAVRLDGIDAPELGQVCTIKGQAYDCGMVARTALLDLTAGATVTCGVLAEVPPGDATEGTPARCHAGGYDLSEGMAYTGWALADRTRGRDYVTYQQSAQRARRGLWRGAFVAPWDWRAGKRLPESHPPE